jgi:4-hydroxybenzoate polyprenyltransferase
MWLKPFALMLVASVYALGQVPEPGRYALGALIVGPLVWGGLYMLNMASDVTEDRFHPVKCQRPFPSGRVDVRLGIRVSLVLIFLGVVLSWLMAPLFAIVVAVMVLKQCSYSLPPLRLKERRGWDIVSGSLGNSALRFAAGWFLFTSSIYMPLLLIVFAECLQIAGFLVNRLFTNYDMSIERKLRYRSSTAFLSRPAIQRIIIGCWAVALGAILLLALNSQLKFLPQILGMLPPQSLFLFVLLLAALPSFKNAMQRAGRFSYRDSKVYIDLSMLYLFILAVVLSMIMVRWG